MFYNRTLLLIVVMTASALTGYCQQPSLEKTFGTDYHHAKQWLSENSWIGDSLQAYGVPPNEAIAVIFPELIRYSYLWDQLEVTGLTVLYIRMGKSYADFSVGQFQMKPSFVEDLETEAPRWLGDAEIRRICPQLLHADSGVEARRQRVNNLCLPRCELQYLALFYKISMACFKDLPVLDEKERIRFLATAYNCGFRHDAMYIRDQMTRKFFPLSGGLRAATCNYADVALSWWNEAQAGAMKGR